MHYSRPTKKTAYKRGIFLIFTLALAMAVPGIGVSAADTEETREETEQDDASGHVYVRAAVEEGCETDITVTLIPVEKGDHTREYQLNPQNRYGVSDDLPEGNYLCVPYISDPEQGSSVYVEYGGGEKAVAQGEETCFLVVAGSAGFVRDCLWISDYKDENGDCLKGVLSRQTVEDAFQKTIARQKDDRSPAENAAPTELAVEEDSTAYGQAEAALRPEAEEPAGAARVMKGKRVYAAAALIVIAAVVYHSREKYLEQPH